MSSQNLIKRIEENKKRRDSANKGNRPPHHHVTIVLADLKQNLHQKVAAKPVAKIGEVKYRKSSFSKKLEKLATKKLKSDKNFISASLNSDKPKLDGPPNTQTQKTARIT